MKNKFIVKLLITVATIGVTLPFIGAESEAQHVSQLSYYDDSSSLNAKLADAKTKVNNFKRLKSIKSHREAQKAVNKVHAHTSQYYAYEKKKLQKQIDIVLKYNILRQI